MHTGGILQNGPGGAFAPRVAPRGFFDLTVMRVGVRGVQDVIFNKVDQGVQLAGAKW